MIKDLLVGAVCFGFLFMVAGFTNPPPTYEYRILMERDKIDLINDINQISPAHWRVINVYTGGGYDLHYAVMERQR